MQTIYLYSTSLQIFSMGLRLGEFRGQDRTFRPSLLNRALICRNTKAKVPLKIEKPHCLRKQFYFKRFKVTIDCQNLKKRNNPEVWHSARSCCSIQPFCGKSSRTGSSTYFRTISSYSLLPMVPFTTFSRPTPLTSMEPPTLPLGDA